MKRTQGIGLLAAGFLLAPASVHAAPPEAQVSVDEIVCRYTDDCAEDEQAEEPAAPVTRGFSFQPAARPSVSSKPTVTPAPSVVKSRPAAPKTVSSARKSKPTIAVSRNDLLISFANNSADLTPQAMANAGVFAQALMSPALKDKHFMIAGHTNATGSRELNIDLSRRRAEAVAQFLESKGVERSRLRLRGYGFDEPLPGSDPSAPSNRRVEASVIKPE
ncbi:MAG: OmpA family protein [Novosphingobium sp.]|nr:OmpA family protein [Novosphingobium sp.]